MSTNKRKHNKPPNQSRSYVQCLLPSLLVVAVAVAFTTVCWISTHDGKDVEVQEIGWVVSDPYKRECLIMVVPLPIYPLKSLQPKSFRLSVPCTTPPRSHLSPPSAPALRLSPQVSKYALSLLSLSNWFPSTRRAITSFLTSSSCRLRKTFPPYYPPRLSATLRCPLLSSRLDFRS